jgi:integrase
LPASRNKVKQDLCRPLSGAAQAVLAELPRFANAPYVFTVNGRRALRGHHRIKVRLDAQSGVAGWILHDLRRTSRSLMSRAGVHPDIAERCLGHAIPGIRGIYDRHAYRQEMLHAFEALASQIERIVHPQDNVLAMAQR